KKEIFSYSMWAFNLVTTANRVRNRDRVMKRAKQVKLLLAQRCIALIDPQHDPFVSGIQLDVEFLVADAFDQRLDREDARGAHSARNKPAQVWRWQRPRRLRTNRAGLAKGTRNHGPQLSLIDELASPRA